MASHVEFFSEFAQDRLLFERFFWNVRGRVFVDIDLRDGVCRNSLFFERNLDWSGLCLAATDIAVTGLKASRRAICGRFPITDWQMDADQEANDAPANGFSALFETHSIRNVDYCSIDANGNELRILAGLDPDRFQISVLTVRDSSTRDRTRALMAAKGYDLYATLETDDLFKRTGLKPLPRNPDLDLQIGLAMRQGVELQKRGRFDDAERAYKRALEMAPANFDALHFEGILRAQSGDMSAAISLFVASLALNPDNAAAQFNCANALRALKRNDEAIQAYDRAIALKPDHAQAHANRGSLLHEMGELHEALASYGRALALNPNQAAAQFNRGSLLRDMGRLEEALAGYDQALSLKPDHAGALRGRANTLLEMNRHQDALAALDRCLALDASTPDMLVYRGNVLVVLERYSEALASFDDAIKADSRDVRALNGRGHVLARLSRAQDSLQAYNRALEIEPADVNTLVNRGALFIGLGRFEEAAADFERALQIEPDRSYLRGSALECNLHCCNWQSWAQQGPIISAELKAGRRVIRPNVIVNAFDSIEDHLRCARLWIENEYPALPPLWRGAIYPHERIRLAYLSPEVGFNPVATQIVSVYEHHDKTRFETIFVSFGRDGNNPMRQRIDRAFERTLDIRNLTDLQAAQMLREMEIDILVDLAGLTGGCRTGILARRPAPVQVNYLGFPGTMGADYIDYLIADRTTVPFEEQSYFVEKIAQLPDTLMPTDSGRPISHIVPSRSAANLPERAFVFCSFNNSIKFNPPVFDIWMRLLRAVKESVFWLPRFNPTVVKNLAHEAERRGVSPDRLRFAPFVADASEHLARLTLADLCLDTLPYNAHATACDALWAGLPILTCVGKTMPGRVAASLLRAMGLPELITHSLEEYEAMATKLAADPQALLALRRRLRENRETSPLFDTVRFTRNLEAAFTQMWERYRSGQAPASFAVEGSS